MDPASPIHEARSPLGVLAEARRVAPTIGRPIREAADLSLGQVARQIGITRQTLSLWERGEARPTNRAAAVAYLRLLRELSELAAEVSR
jgi:DNA-binding transcriptional regulator YiaG